MDQRIRRDRMVARLIAGRGVEAPGVLEAMRTIPRHRFVEEALADKAYGDHALPIGKGQTISQPIIVARMAELLQLRTSDAVLEIVHHFGAASYETQKVEGHWRHGEVLYRDNLVKLVVDAPDTGTNRQWMRKFKSRWKSRFEQLELWMISYRIEVELDE